MNKNYNETIPAGQVLSVSLDEQGRPRAIASLRPVKRTGENVIRKVRQWILSGKR